MLSKTPLSIPVVRNWRRIQPAVTIDCCTSILTSPVKIRSKLLTSTRNFSARPCAKTVGETQTASNNLIQTAGYAKEKKSWKVVYPLCGDENCGSEWVKTGVNREEGWSQSEKSQDILSYLRCVCDDDDDDKTLRGSIVSKLCLFDLSDSELRRRRRKKWKILGKFGSKTLY